MRLAERRGECLARELEYGEHKRFGRARSAPERAQNECGLAARELGGGTLERTERHACAVELERRAAAVGQNGNDENRARPRARRSVPDCSRRIREIGDGRRRKLCGGHASSFELGGECGRAGDCYGFERVTDEHPDKHCVCGRDDAGSLGDVVERAGEARALRGGRDCARESCKRPERDA